MLPETGPEPARAVRLKARGGDRVFLAVLTGSGLLVLTIIAVIGGFLGTRASQALHVAGTGFLTTAAWSPGNGTGGVSKFGVAGILTGTVLIGARRDRDRRAAGVRGGAVTSRSTRRRGSKPLFTSLIDLMAAVPSVVYGLWGFLFLEHRAVGVAHWLATYLGWIPAFRVTGARVHDPLAPLTVYTASTFIAGTVVGLMITPIVSSMMRESFSQAPLGEREGAYALGATRWGMIRTVVLPFGRGGVIGGAMLGWGARSARRSRCT